VDQGTHEVPATAGVRFGIDKVICQKEVLVVADFHPVPDRDSQVGFTPFEDLFTLSWKIIIH
jgi:hypothetical protein